LRQQVIKSRERLGLEQIGLWQLHSIDPKVPRDEQFAAIKSLQDDGIVHHAGLSNVSILTSKLPPNQPLAERGSAPGVQQGSTPS